MLGQLVWSSKGNIATIGRRNRTTWSRPHWLCSGEGNNGEIKFLDWNLNTFTMPPNLHGLMRDTAVSMKIYSYFFTDIHQSSQTPTNDGVFDDILSLSWRTVKIFFLLMSMMIAKWLGWVRYKNCLCHISFTKEHFRRIQMYLQFSYFFKVILFKDTRYRYQTQSPDTNTRHI